MVAGCLLLAVSMGMHGLSSRIVAVSLRSAYPLVCRMWQL